MYQDWQADRTELSASAAAFGRIRTGHKVIEDQKGWKRNW